MKKNQTSQKTLSCFLHETEETIKKLNTCMQQLEMEFSLLKCEISATLNEHTNFSYRLKDFDTEQKLD